MDFGVRALIFALFFFFFFSALFALPSTSSSTAINSKYSVLVALLNSAHYTEFAELVQKALLLQYLEDAVGNHKYITIFAPKERSHRRDRHYEFKRFLQEPANLKSLQALLLFHVIPTRIHYNASSYSIELIKIPSNFIW